MPRWLTRWFDTRTDRQLRLIRNGADLTITAVWALLIIAATTMALGAP